MAWIAQKREDHRCLTVCHFGTRRQLVDNQVAQMSDIPDRDVQQQIVYAADVKHLENFGEPPNVCIERAELYSGMSSEPHRDDRLEGNPKGNSIHLCMESFDHLGLQQLTNSRETTRGGHIDLCCNLLIG